MTVFAGAFAMAADQKIPQSLKEQLAVNLSRASKESGSWHSCDRHRMYLVKWDSGAFKESAWRTDDDGSVCALAGDPLFIADQSRSDRQQQLALLAPASQDVPLVEFAKCRGSFALVHYAARNGELRLATDAIGLRSIYYTLHDGLLIFSTALRVLEAISEVDKSLSWHGMAEHCVFSFPLADRTPYDNIKVLRESEILSATASGIGLSQYLDWVVPVEPAEGPRSAAAQLHIEFQKAIALRAGKDERVYSFLSGGMDSRAIVATLVQSGRNVEALNFSADRTQDQSYARSFAAEIPDQCRLHCLPGGIYPNFSFLALAAKIALEQKEVIAVDRPQFIWSGDGGSVGLGHVYMDEHTLDVGDSLGIAAMVRSFMTFNHLSFPVGVLRNAARLRLQDDVFNCVQAELDRYPVSEIGRRLYLFLLFNDQRRHLFKHFETIDQHGLELLTPFYDTQFLRMVAATPVRWGVLHRLYSAFFEHLPTFALKTPWQTYPGHMPCLLPPDTQSSYQWSSPRPLDGLGLIERGRLSLGLLRATDFKAQMPIFSITRIWIAALLHLLTLRDCRHILPALQTYQRFSAIARKTPSL